MLNSGGERDDDDDDNGDEGDKENEHEDNDDDETMCSLLFLPLGIFLSLAFFFLIVDISHIDHTEINVLQERII